MLFRDNVSSRVIICHRGDVHLRKVELRMNEIYKYKAIKECCDNGCSKSSKNRAATKLNLSKRRIDRLIIKYKERGKSAFIHGNRSKKPNNKIDSNLSESIRIILVNSCRLTLVKL